MKLNERVYKAIVNSFISWYNCEEISEDQKTWLYNNTSMSDYDSPGGYYAAAGYIDSEGNLTDLGRELVEEGSSLSVGTQEAEPKEITAEEWAAGGYYAAVLTGATNNSKDVEEVPAVGFDDYKAAREYLHAEQLHITAQTFQTKADYFPGLLTYQAGVDIFQGANEEYLTFPAFPEFSKTVKIKLHDTVALAADTGAGKSSLAINFLDQLNDKFPVLYINLEMDAVTILRRLVSIRTGIELDVIEGYQKDEHTEELVNASLRGITNRKPLQILSDIYALEDVKRHIQHTTEGREEPTIVFIDHALLLKSGKRASSRYERFTEVSEELRWMSRKYNIIMFVLLQQNRAGKADAEKRPANDSLKESGSWENDATHIMFLWWDPALKRKCLILTKNRNGSIGDIVLNYWPRTQTYREAKVTTQTKTRKTPAKARQTSRDKGREKMEAAYTAAMIATEGNPTLYDVAEAAGVTVGTVKKWAKEYGGMDINGVHYDPAGINDNVEYNGFVRLTPAQENDLSDII